MNLSIDIQSTQQNTKTSQNQDFQQSEVHKNDNKRQVKPKKQFVKSSSWSKAQQRKYVSFLRTNGDFFNLSSKEKASIQINVMMSFKVKSRTSSQCHSHHQKMLIKHGSIQAIIEHYSFLFPKRKNNQSGQRKMKQMFVDKQQKKSNMNSSLRQQVGLLEDSKEEPIWWGYLNLIHDKEQHDQYLFDYFYQ